VFLDLLRSPVSAAVIDQKYKDRNPGAQLLTLQCLQALQRAMGAIV
jgi:hypothetical protein